MHSGMDATTDRTDRIDRIGDSRSNVVRIDALDAAIGRTIDRRHRSHIDRTDTSCNPNESCPAHCEIDAIGYLRLFSFSELIH
jgi:hypothetical protein